MKRVELLAPAGNYESFLGAIHAGADAVYLGGDKFGARAYADNFCQEEVCRAVQYAHLYGRKVYLTLNTLIRETEFGELYEYLSPFYEAGLDGVIVQDIGVFAYVHRQFPLLALHVSTQMTVTGVHAARMLKAEGASRIVPARELSLREIQKMKQETGLEIETFIHGAMCYCYSGQCLFSSILGGRSGNRGRCAQPCRLPYEILMDGRALQGHSRYPMSLKDMCTIQHIPELIRAGIDSFKIEGRMKKPEYAAGVTAVYRRVIDRFYEQGGRQEGDLVSAEDLHILNSLYIRSEVQDGYYFRHNGKEMVTQGAPGYNGSDEDILEQIRDRYLKREPGLPLRMQARFYIGEPARLSVCCGDVQAVVSGDVVSRAVNRPVSRQNVTDGLSALGGTPFRLEELTVEIQEGIFYPLKAIKDLRRRALAELTGLLETKNCPELDKRKPVDMISVKTQPSVPQPGKRGCVRQDQDTKFRLLFTEKKQFWAFLDTGIQASRIYLDSDMCTDPAEWKTVLKDAGHTEVFLVLPYVIRDWDQEYLENLLPVLQLADGCMVRNMEGYAWLKEKRYTGQICGDAGMYIWNRETVRFWENKLSGLCVPYELSAGDQRKLTEGYRDPQDRPGHVFWEQVAYGYLPMMVTANCMAKTGNSGMSCSNGMPRSTGIPHFALRDRYQKEFPVFINCRHCYNVIYNSVPLSLHEKTAARRKKAALYAAGTAFRLDFTIETPEEVKRTLYFFEAFPSEEKAAAPPYGAYTTGHEKRGAE